MSKMDNVRGRELRAPAQTMEFDGEQRKIVFSMETFRIAEDVYEEQYGKDKNFAEIAMDLTKGKIGAVMAVYYAALVVGGLDITWANFAAIFKLTDIPGVKDALIEMTADALPDPEPGEGKEDKKDPLAADAAEPSPGAGSGTGR